MKRKMIAPMLMIMAMFLAVPVIAQDVPYGVASEIRANAEKEWPDNYRMQKHAIDSQTEAYKKLENLNSIQGVPYDVMAKIKDKAASEWGNNYRMRVHAIESQAKAYLELNR